MREWGKLRCAGQPKRLLIRLPAWTLHRGQQAVLGKEQEILVGSVDLAQGKNQLLRVVTRSAPIELDDEAV